MNLISCIFLKQGHNSVYWHGCLARVSWWYKYPAKSAASRSTNYVPRTVGVARWKILAFQWLRMPSIGQNLQPVVTKKIDRFFKNCVIACWLIILHAFTLKYGWSQGKIYFSIIFLVLFWTKQKLFLMIKIFFSIS